MRPPKHNFTVTGNGVNQTVKTNSKGEIQIDNLMPGVYTVTEMDYDKYEPQESRRVTVVSGQVSTVNFNNKLKRGDLQIVKSSEDNLNEGVTFHLYGTSLSGIAVDEYAATDANGVATFEDVLISGSTPYTVEEVDTAVRYIVPKAQSAPINWNEVTNRSFLNILKKFSVTVTKSDAETGTVQGDASLAGAVYGIYKGETLVDTYTTDKNGQFVTKEYICDNDWTVREITPSEGYLLDSTVHKVGAEPQLYTVEHNQTANDVTEQVVKGNIAIIKHTDNGDTQIETPESGAEFAVYLKAAGSYEVAEDTERDYLTCDENGFAQTKDMLSDTKYPVTFGYADQDTAVVKIAANDGKAIENDLIYGSVSGKKVDENGNALGGALIGLFRTDDGEFTKENALMTTTSAEDGSFSFESIPYGTWYVREIEQPAGFVLDDTIYPVTIGADGQVVEIKIVNKYVRGNIHLTKVDSEYPDNKLTGATFEVYKDSNANGKLDDGDELLGTLTEKEIGEYGMNDLFYGRYFIRETKAPEGFVLDTGVYEVMIDTNGKTYEVENKAGVGFINDAMRGNLKIVKTSSDGKVKGFAFRITGANGYDIILETNDKGEIFIDGLRIGDYTISEVSNSASSMYVLPAEKKATVKLGSTTIVEMHNVLRDTPKTGDTTNLPLLYALAGLSAVGIAVCGVIGFKKKKKEDRN